MRHAPDHQISAADPLIIDLDATLVAAHSEKEQAAATYKRGFGFHPLCAFVDHGPGGTGEAPAIMLRPGNAGSNTAADHIRLTRQALNAVPRIRACRPGKKVLIRADSAGGTHAYLDWLHARGLQYSVGFVLPEPCRSCTARSPNRRGRPRSMRISSRVRARMSRTSPTCWTWPATRTGCGSSCVANVPTLGRSCVSMTSAATG